MKRIRRRRSVYLTLFAILLFISIYLYLNVIDPNKASEIIMTILGIVAGVAFWLEYHHNNKINEAEFMIELNNQFLNDMHMCMVEHKLEQYYAIIKDNRENKEIEKYGDHLRSFFDIACDERQYLVNYLVHLEGIATLVNTGVLRLKTINDLMAYRYFLAVNNPIVQELELLPYKDYYQGIINVYEEWSKYMNDTMPLQETRLDIFL